MRSQISSTVWVPIQRALELNTEIDSQYIFDFSFNMLHHFTPKSTICCLIGEAPEKASAHAGGFSITVRISVFLVCIYMVTQIWVARILLHAHLSLLADPDKSFDVTRPKNSSAMCSSVGSETLDCFVFESEAMWTGNINQRCSESESRILQNMFMSDRQYDFVRENSSHTRGVRKRFLYQKNIFLVEKLIYRMSGKKLILFIISY